MRPRIRATALTGYPQLSASVGLDPDRLAAEAGLDPADVGAPGRWIPAAAAARLLELSAQRSGCAEFGLRLGAVRQLGMLGPLSVVLRDEPTLGAALRLLIRYAPSYDESVHMRLAVRRDLTRLDLWLDLGEPAPTTQLTDLVLGSVLAHVRALVGARWLPGSVSFTHGPPGDPGPYRLLCGPRVRFAAESTALAFPTPQLESPVITSDPSLRPYTRMFLREIASSGAGTAAARTTEAVELLLPLGRCSVQEVARQLGLPPRELQRRLAEEDCSYSAVVDSVRAHTAVRHLENGRRSLTEISQLLGFEAPSAFSRWFAQHFGSSPSAWRSTARGTPAPAGTADAGSRP
ncbi:AraC family transcriptional regulator [Blastococcus sp. URHD0036]|uniref:AraC family transcriptional regulator n=1 Tax=Blastococcus sp. URHD0036 TaxID=1380356 RepID=UPI00068B029E|nr:AraC family transcriptional regulator [Blastococcus sp. URHD0036]